MVLGPSHKCVKMHLSNLEFQKFATQDGSKGIGVRSGEESDRIQKGFSWRKSKDATGYDPLLISLTVTDIAIFVADAKSWCFRTHFNTCTFAGSLKAHSDCARRRA
jgi:hypothetical protein